MARKWNNQLIVGLAMLLRRWSLLDRIRRINGAYPAPQEGGISKDLVTSGGLVRRTFHPTKVWACVTNAVLAYTGMATLPRIGIHPPGVHRRFLHLHLVACFRSKRGFQRSFVRLDVEASLHDLLQLVYKAR